MLKLIARVAAPLLAATAIAQAADHRPAAQITWIDHQAGRILLDNSQFYTPAAIDGLAVGQMFAMPGATAAAEPRKAGMNAVIEMSANGRVSYIDASGHSMLVANVMVRTPDSFDMAQVAIGQKLEVIYTSSSGMNAAKRIAWAGKPMFNVAAAKTSGHITFIDAAAGTVLVNNYKIELPGSIDIKSLRIGDMIEASLTGESGKSAASRI